MTTTKTKTGKKTVNAKKTKVQKQNDFILLDRTGSMSGMWDEALSSIDAYVKQLAVDKVDTQVTLAVFDRNGDIFSFDVVRDKVAPEAWTRPTPQEAFPRGMTPLNQAIHQLVGIARGVDSERAAIIIVTDGEENSSNLEYTQASAKAELDFCRNKGWQVVFLGANFDNVLQARRLGTNIGQTVSAAPGMMCATLSATAVKRGLYGATGQSMSYSDDERKKFSSIR